MLRIHLFSLASTKKHLAMTGTPEDRYGGRLLPLVEVTAIIHAELNFSSTSSPACFIPSSLSLLCLDNTQAPIRVCLDGTIIDSRTTLVTMCYCGCVGV